MCPSLPVINQSGARTITKRGRRIKRRTWALAALAVAALGIGLVTSPAYAQSDSYVIGRYLESELNPKPKPLPDFDKEVMEAVRDTQHQEAIRVEAVRVAEEAKHLAEEQTQEAARAVPVQPPQLSGTCADWIARAGITDAVNAMWIIQKESGCNPYARNPSSTACGIGQDINGCTVGYDPVAQLVWMNNYVISRYKSWAGAVSFWRVNHYY
jgi:hypothetical protein